jgi:hypothetical protein
MPEIIGRFYFKQTSNGNLIGEFSNHQSDQIFTESADLKPESDDGNYKYVGKYFSTWREKGEARYANLTIKPGRSNKLFILEWIGDRCNFKGEGMLCDNILIGDYQSVP